MRGNSTQSHITTYKTQTPSFFALGTGQQNLREALPGLSSGSTVQVANREWDKTATRQYVNSRLGVLSQTM